MANMSQGNPAAGAIGSLPNESVNNGVKAARAAATAQGIRNQQLKFDNYADVLMDAKPYNQNELDVPNSAFMIGQFLPVDSDFDRKMLTWLTLPSDEGMTAAQRAAFGNVSFGSKQQPTQLLMDWSEEKYQQAQYRGILDLAAMLIDPTDPRSQEKAFALYPELREIPEQRSLKIMKMHMMMEAIIRSGTITSREENEFIYQLLDPKSIIPVLPPWVEIVSRTYGTGGGLDVTGTISAVPGSLTGLGAGVQASMSVLQFRNGNSDAYGLFNPWFYSLKPQDGEMDADPQLRLKFLIMRRLYPALRKAESNTELLNVLKKLYNRGNSDIVTQLSASGPVNAMLEFMRSGKKVEAAAANVKYEV
jgi:hypothetical protein